MEKYVEAFFGSQVSLNHDSVLQAYARALTASLRGEFRSLHVDEAQWALEVLGPRGHACPLLGFESRHGCLVPTGSNVWNAHELYCAVDWTCNRWCGLDSETDTEARRASCLDELSAAGDPATRCAFRAYIAVLQGGFGLPRLQRPEPATAPP